MTDLPKTDFTRTIEVNAYDVEMFMSRIEGSLDLARSFDNKPAIMSLSGINKHAKKLFGLDVPTEIDKLKTKINMENKHTQGPWRHAIDFELYEENRYSRIVSGDEYFPKGFSITGFMKDADAQLIASAPELLEALQILMTQYKSGIGINGQKTWHWVGGIGISLDDLTKSEQVINKALGLTNSASPETQRNIEEATKDLNL